MKINIDQKAQNPYFGIKVSKDFINLAHYHYNCTIGANRRQNVYNFNLKVSEFENFGKDNYVLEYLRKQKGVIGTHFLIAKNINNPKEKPIVILKTKTLKKLVDYFMNIKKNNFLGKFNN